MNPHDQALREFIRDEGPDLYADLYGADEKPMTMTEALRRAYDKSGGKDETAGRVQSEARPTDPDTGVRGPVPGHGDLRGLRRVGVSDVGSGSADAADNLRAEELAEDKVQTPETRPAASALWVPVGRAEAAKLLKHNPPALWLYIKLQDEAARSRWAYADEETGDQLFYADFEFGKIDEGTILLDLEQWAEMLEISNGLLKDGLRYFFSIDLLEALHFGLEIDDEGVSSVEAHGRPIAEFIGPSESYYGLGDEWSAWAVVRMNPPAKGHVRMPKGTLALKGKRLVFLVTVYLRARHRPKGEVEYRGRFYSVKRGEVIVSPAELAQEFDVHRRQIQRWAEYAKRDGLLRRTPQGRDCRWKIVTYPWTPKGRK